MANTVFSHAYDNMELTLGEAINSVVTSFALGTGDGAKLGASKMPVIISVGNDTTPGIYEFIRIESFTGDQVDTCTRGYLNGIGAPAATSWPDAQTMQNRTAAQEINQFLEALEIGWEASACDPILNDIRALGVLIAGSGVVQVTTSGGQVQWTAMSQGGAAVGEVMQYNGSAWLPVASGSGDASGPAGATDNAVARFDTATGKLIQNSGVLIDDSDNVTIPGTIIAGSGSAVITTAAGLLVPAKLDQDGAVANQSLVWNGVDWGPDTVGAPNGTAVDNAVPRFDLTTGRLMQNSGVLIDDSDNMTIPGIITAGTGTPTILTNAIGELLLTALEQDGAAGNEVMTWNNVALKWEPQALTTIGVVGPVTSLVNAIPTWGDSVGDALLSSGATIDPSTSDMTLGGTKLLAGASFDLLDTLTTTLNIGRAATGIQMGAAAGTTTIRNNLVLGGGYLGTTSTTLQIGPLNAVNISIGGALTTILSLGSVSTTVSIANDLDITGELQFKGGDLTTNQTTFNLLDSSATTINAFGAATTLDLGAATGTTSVKNGLTVDGVIVNMANLPTADPSVSGQLWINGSNQIEVSP